MTRFLIRWSLGLCWLLTTFAAHGIADDQKPDSADKDFSAELPRIAPKTPDDALKSFLLKPGFHIELVGSEPLIRSPMAMDFDEFGRAFVVELPEYNQYGSTKPHGKGAIKLLEDTNGDGRFDKATVYVDDLNYPTAVACWDGGILVGVAPDILYCKDTDGDGRADIRQKLFTGFGMDKAGEGMLNSFCWRIDNRFHIPTGLDGGEITSVGERGGVSPRTVCRRSVRCRKGANALRLASRHNFSTVQAGRNVKPIVDSPANRIEHPFAGLIHSEAGEEFLADVGLAVSVGVFAEEDVRRDTDQDAAIPTRHGRRIVEVIDIDRRFVVATVAVRVLQQLDRSFAVWLCAAVLVVFGKLDDKRSAEF
ncbi:MAG: PVC-type heme-binding CxxCH protein, partial [Planctomycetaceae bacterium]